MHSHSGITGFFKAESMVLSAAFDLAVNWLCDNHTAHASKDQEGAHESMKPNCKNTGL